LLSHAEDDGDGVHSVDGDDNQRNLKTIITTQAASKEIKDMLCSHAYSRPNAPTLSFSIKDEVTRHGTSNSYSQCITLR